MIERKGDLFSPDNKIIVIPTYGDVKKGSLVMNKGIAEIAKNKWPELSKAWGKMIEKYGHHMFAHKTECGVSILSFPIVFYGSKMPDKKSVIDGCRKLLNIADSNEVGEIFMPRVGCARGELSWSEIKDDLEEILDDRFVVITQDAVSELRLETVASRYDKYFQN